MNYPHKQPAHLFGALLLLAFLLAAIAIESVRSSRRTAAQASDSTEPHRVIDVPIQHLDSARKAVPSSGDARRSPRPSGAFLLDEQVQAPDGPATEVLRQLTPLALKGDSNAALKLYMTLSRCDLALHHPSAPDRLSTILTSEEIAELKAEQAAIERDCATVVTELKTRGRWLEMAAQGGEPQAQILYSIDAESILGDRRDILKNPDDVKRYRDRAVGYLKALSARGSLDAMVQLSSSYESGVLLERSDVLAFAYLQAASLSDPDPAYLELSAPIRSRLTLSEQAEAMRFARNLHQSCCRGAPKRAFQ